MTPRRLDTVAVALLLVALPLGTAPLEIATGAVVALALARPERFAARAAPGAAEAVALAVLPLVFVGASGDLREALGQAWPLAPLLALPALRPDPRVVAAGVAAAGVAAAWGVAQALGGEPARAGFSHHLTLAYALLPPLGLAVARGWWGPAAVLGAGALATASAGVLVPLGVTMAVARRGWAWAWMLAGAAVLLAGIAGAADAEELRQRAVIWTGALSLADAPVGPGGYPAASAAAYDRLSPGFWFPNHAHDSYLQSLATLGWAGLAARVALVAALVRGAPRAGAAGVAGVALGALTQDTFGDLEVARAAWVWVALAGTLAAPPRSEAATEDGCGSCPSPSCSPSPTPGWRPSRPRG